MPQLDGILETALYVSDLEQSRMWYERVLGFRELMREEGRLIGMAVQNSRQVLLLFRESVSTRPTETPGGTIPPHDGHGDLHLAFAVSPDTLPDWKAHFAAEGIKIESEVSVEKSDDRRGGISLYFRDPDHHLVELATRGIWPTY